MWISNSDEALWLRWEFLRLTQDVSTATQMRKSEDSSPEICSFSRMSCDHEGSKFASSYCGHSSQTELRHHNPQWHRCTDINRLDTFFILSSVIKYCRFEREGWETKDWIRIREYVYLNFSCFCIILNQYIFIQSDPDIWNTVSVFLH